MDRITEIETRMQEIRAAIELDDANLDDLQKEATELRSEREAIKEEVQKRNELRAAVANDTEVVRVISVLDTQKEHKSMEFQNMTAQEVRATEEYRSAFLKMLQGKSLAEVEKRAYEMASADVAGVIPTATQNQIFNKLVESAPLLGEITLLQVPGNVTFAVEGTNTAAALHGENVLAEPAGDTLGSVSLAGFEIIKVLRISATVQAMAIGAFEGWLTDYLAEGISRKIGGLLVYGSGQSQPKGIDYTKAWSSGTNAVIPAGATPTYAELTTLVSYLKGGYHRRAKFLMNSKTFWGSVVPAQDNSKYKILNDDNTRLLGYPILLDDNVSDGDIFFGDMKKVVANLSQNIKVDRSTESGFLYNSIDYRGTAIFDCDIAVDEAFVKCAKVLTAGA